MITQKQETSLINDFELFERFQFLLERHFAEYAYADLFADKLGVSQKKLNTVTRNFTGKTACQLVEEKLVTQAKDFLKKPLKIKQIASQLGYEDQYYFSRIFKRRTGHSPKHFRNTLSKQEK